MLKTLTDRIRHSFQLGDGFTWKDVLASVRTKPTAIASFKVDDGAPPSDLSELAQLAIRQTGEPFLKWWHYFDAYSVELSPLAAQSRQGLCDQPPGILEIGTWRGGSLELWREFFGPDAVVFGVDIDPGSAQFNGKHAQVRIGSQTDPGFMNSVVDEMGKLNVVIDDGSHRSQDIALTLEILWPRLEYGGIYIIEDLHTSYWPAWGGGLRRRSSAIEVLKKLVDHMHEPYFKRTLDPAVRGVVRENLFSITFYDSVAVLRKRHVGWPRPFRGGDNS